MLARLLLLAVVLGWVSTGCDRRPEPGPNQRGSAALRAPSARRARPAQVAPAALRYRYAAPERLVAFGDVHGDLAATRAALRLAEAIDAADRWIGAALVVVQTGDQLDRGDQDRQTVDLLQRLQAQARAAGGALHVLNGNHEAMNVLGDFRYVSPAGFAQFADLAPGEDRDPRVVGYPPERRGRARAFLPGGSYARRLADHNTILVVGDTLFAHGGVLPAHVRHGVAAINEEIRAWMRGEAPGAPESAVGEDSPVWTRAYSEARPDADRCRMLAGVLDSLGARRLVVGHTVQRAGISSGCDGRLWRIDVGLAGYYGGRLEVLEIRGGHVRVVKPAAAP